MMLDRMKSGLAAFVQGVLPQVDYLALYSGRVVAQGGPNSFDFQPDDPRVPGMSGIPLKLPFPGFSIQLNAGASPRCMVGWAGGNPGLPFVCLWEPPGASAIGIDAPQVNLGDASAFVGRVGDAVSSSAAFVTWLGLVGTATGAGVAPVSIGTISAGSSKVKA